MDCCSNPLCECPPGACHCTPDHCCCDMRGLLQFTLLWELSLAEGSGRGGRANEVGGSGSGGAGGMTGQELGRKVERRRGYRPSPGTLYPALKALSEKGLVDTVKEGRQVRYQLTLEGREGLDRSARYFVRSFGDLLQRYAAEA